MSVEVKRSTKWFSSLVNMTIKLEDVTLDRVAPGESVTFELPDQSDRVTIKAYFSKKEIIVSDGDVIQIVRDNRVMIYKIIARLLTAGLIILTPLSIAVSPYIFITIALFILLCGTYIDYFVPDFNLIKAPGDK